MAVPVIAASSPLSVRWAELRKDDLRVATVMYRLAIANRHYCRDALASQSGFALHGIEQYGLADRQQAARSFGLGPYIGVMAVVANSPAARAGLNADDQLISVNGRELPFLRAEADAPTNALVEAVRDALEAEMQKGEVTLLVTGPHGKRTVRFTAEEGCRSAVEVVPGKVVNASADGRRVIVSAGLLERCATDDDLALVIAHELAHNLLHHAAVLARAGVSPNGLLHSAGSGTAEMRQMEEEADRLGVRLATVAAYDLRGAASFLSGLQTPASANDVSGTHPAPGRRLRLLTAAVAEASGRRGPDPFAVGPIPSMSSIPEHLPRRSS